MMHGARGLLAGGARYEDLRESRVPPTHLVLVFAPDPELPLLEGRVWRGFVHAPGHVPLVRLQVTMAWRVSGGTHGAWPHTGASTTGMPGALPAVCFIMAISSSAHTSWLGDRTREMCTPTCVERTRSEGVRRFQVAGHSVAMLLAHLAVDGHAVDADKDAVRDGDPHIGGVCEGRVTVGACPVGRQAQKAQQLPRLRSHLDLAGRPPTCHRRALAKVLAVTPLCHGYLCPLNAPYVE
jgi:hypothetical protein